MLPPDFSVTVGRHRDAVALAAAGELDLATAPLLAAHLDAVGAGDAAAVVLDLSRVTFLAACGVALLLGVARRAAGEGWPLRIAGTPPHALRVLEVCGVLEALPLVGA